MVTIFSGGAGVSNIPTPLTGSSIRALQRAMLKLNARVHGSVRYIGAPQWVDKENAWVVWYYIDQKIEDQLQGALDGDK